MSDEIMLVFGEAGVAREYDDTWDITIHCESEEEQKAVLEKIKNSNQEAKHSTESSLTQKVKKTCITCKHYPPESKWPCIDCDMRNPADRWEPQELSKNSPKLDKENGDLQPTCNKLATVANDTNVPCKDTISRQKAIEALGERPLVWTDDDQYALGERNQYDMDRLAIETMPSAQPEPQWIPVSKKSHPDTPERVQVQLDNGWIITAYYEENEWLSVPYCDEPIEDRWIEAWKPLPEPYRAERRTDERPD